MKQVWCVLLWVLTGASEAAAAAPELLAGAAKVDISRVKAAPSGNTLYAKALVLKAGGMTAVVVTVDAVAIEEIGSIKAPYLTNVRSKLKDELGVAPANVLINASHCHGSVCADVEARTVQAVREAAKNLVPVKVAAGTGFEDRIMENRRLILKSGREADVRHAYAMPPDDEVAAIGPVDPEIGILRLDRKNGETLALVYNFAVHPIQGTAALEGNTADIAGFASKVIEDSLSGGAIALFLQGCGGDINPVRYKDVSHPRDAEPLGNLLGLSVVRASHGLRSEAEATLSVVNERVGLPRADLAKRIEEMNGEEEQLLGSLKGSSLNLKTFLPLYVKYGISGDFPSYYSHGYLLDEKLGRSDLERLDEKNRGDMERYITNVHVMETLTRLLVNRRLLEKHQDRNTEAGMKPIEVEVAGLRVGEFRLVTFPGELTVQIGLNVKKASPHEMTFVAGYTNGYIYYCPTAEQLSNRGGAQEDSDCLLAPGWQAIFERKAAEILGRL